jgi:hypothetical protein
MQRGRGRETEGQRTMTEAEGQRQGYRDRGRRAGAEVHWHS